LEDELLSAIQEESSAARVNGDDGRFSAIDAYFAGDDNETEVERRRSLLRLLSCIRPQLADLLGGPPADLEIYSGSDPLAFREKISAIESNRPPLGRLDPQSLRRAYHMESAVHPGFWLDRVGLSPTSPGGGAPHSHPDSSPAS
jgi:hypothetical protein